MTYSQSTGVLTFGAMTINGCYAGRGAAKNNASWQVIKNFGPLPQGKYTIGPMHTVPHLGPCCSLTPYPENEMFERSGFFLHLDNPLHPGASSDGCVVLPNGLDLATVDHERGLGDTVLEVTA